MTLHYTDKETFRQALRENNCNHVKVNYSTLQHLLQDEAFDPVTRFSGQVTYSICNNLEDNIIEI